MGRLRLDWGPQEANKATANSNTRECFMCFKIGRKSTALFVYRVVSEEIKYVNLVIMVCKPRQTASFVKTFSFKLPFFARFLFPVQSVFMR